MNMQVDREERRERLRSKKEWLEKRIEESCPAFLDAHRFEYNDFYDFWRSSYYRNTRKMIGDYEALKGIHLGGQYDLYIDGQHIYITKLSEHVDNRYESLLANIPLDSPLEPEDVWKLHRTNPDIEFCSGRFANTLKSHVLTCHEKAVVLKLVPFYREELGPMGYSIQAYFKGRGREMDYSVVITHSTETPDACIQSLISNGFAPYDMAKEKTQSKAKKTAEIDKEALSAREQELLKELEAVRKKLAN